VAVEVFQIGEDAESVDEVLERVRQIRYRIVMVSLPQRSLQQVLCRRLSLTMVWPEYAWLVVSSQNDATSLLRCKHKMINFYPKKLWTSSLSSNLSRFSYDKLIIGNFTYKSGIANFCDHVLRPIAVAIYQWDDYPVHIASYSAVNGLGKVSLHRFPYDVPVEASLLWYILFTLLHLLIFILLTVVFVLYVSYRNRSSVKASSVSLSILIFVSCYILLAYLAIINLTLHPGYRRTSKKFQDTLCKLRIWSHGFSMPTVTIVAVLLIKLVRIYKLFNNQVVMKKWKCHDAVLAVYVFLVSFPVLVMCAVDSLSHQYKSALIFSHTRYFIDCRGTGLFYIQPVYIFMLCSLLVCMAVKTRKIRLGDFKDTKKMVSLMVVVFVSFIGFLIYFFLLRIGRSVIVAAGVKQISTSLLIFGNIFFQFVPKLNFLLKK